MAFWDRAKCFTGFHEWGGWSYKTLGSCDQGRICLRLECTKTETRTEHGFGEWGFTAEHSCDQRRICGRCGSDETRTTHTWPDWSYLAAEKCEQARRCARCGEMETRQEHVWDVWQYASPRSCDHTRFCRRCSAKEERTAKTDDHTWSEGVPVIPGDCKTLMRRCERCGEAGADYAFQGKHDFGQWLPHAAGRRRRVCNHCGEEQIV